MVISTRGNSIKRSAKYYTKGGEIKCSYTKKGGCTARKDLEGSNKLEMESAMNKNYE